MVKINKVSETCERAINVLEFVTAKESGKSAVKLLKNSEAHALVICKTTPNKVEKIKKTAILYSLNNTSASNPKRSTNDLFFDVDKGTFGNVKE